MVPKIWFKKKIIEEILKLHKSGEKLNAGNVSASLRRAGCKEFGSWKNAIENSGLDYSKIRKLEINKWSKQKIIDKIQELNNLGESLNAYNIKNNYNDLYNASYKKKYFNNWGEAVNTAGFDYNLIKKETKRRTALKTTKWTKENIIKKIKDLHKDNESLASSKVKIKGAGLVISARKKFGSWEKAIESAGLNYNKINLRANEEKWNKEKITNRILLIYKEGGDISSSYLRKFNNSLLKAGINHFGTWKKAVESAGIDYIKIMKCIPYKWNKEKVIEEIKRLHKLGEELNDENISENHNALYGAAYTWFKSWKLAVNSAGFDYNKITRFKQNYWSKEKIIEQILKLHNEGAELNDSDIAKKNSGNSDLRGAAIKYFGSWKNAINSSGLNYKLICKDLNEEARKGILFQEYCKQMFKVLNPRIKPQTKKVVSTKCIPDFIDEDLGEWIDIKLNCWGYGVNKTIEKYLIHVDKLIIIYLIGREPKDRENVRFIPIDNYYPQLKLAGKQELIEKFNQLKKGITPTKHQMTLRHFVK